MKGRWNLKKIGAERVRENLQINGTGVLVGVIDTGFSNAHSDLSPRWKSQFGWKDFVNGNSSPYEDHTSSHGTGVTGIIVAGGNSGDNIGVAPGVQFISAKAFDYQGYGSASNILSAMQWMLDPDEDGNPNTGQQHVPDVVNNSWGGGTYDTYFWNAVNSWVAVGIFPVFIAQNFGPNPSTVSAPGSYPQSFCVGAVDSFDVIRSYSGRGPVTWSSIQYIKPDVVAPSEPYIKFCVSPNGYVVGSGKTSTSGPHVTGAVALFKQAHPSWSISQIKNALEGAAIDLGSSGKDNDYGSGRIDVYKAIGRSGTITTSETWSGNVYIIGNVTVNAGVTLTVAAGTTIKFTSGTQLIINGSLNAIGTSSQRITFTGTTATPGFWSGIKINSGSSSNVSTLQRCDVTYATTGITVTYTGNSNNVTIKKCRLSNNSSHGINVNGSTFSGATAHPTVRTSHLHDNGGSGIYLQNYAKPRIKLNRLENNSSYGIYGTGSCSAIVDSNYVYSNASFGMSFVSNSHAQINRNTIKNNDSNGGISASSSSNLVAYSGPLNKGRNQIMSNTGDGIYSSSSSPKFGDITLEDGLHQIQSNTGYQARQVSSGQLKAENCYWGNELGDVSGNVDYVPYLTSVPSPVGWGQSDTYDPSTRVNFNFDWITEGIDIDENASMANPAMIDENDFTSSEFDPIAWSVKFDEAMKRGLEQGEWSEAAGVITELWRELQDARVPAVDYVSLAEYAEAPKVDAAIRKYLALTLVEKSLAAQDITTALNDLEKYRQSNPEHDAELLANSGIISLHFKNDVSAAENVLAQLSAKAAQNDVAAIEQEKILAEMMANYLQHLGNEPASQPAHGAPITSGNGDNSWAVETYPNPFNPETQIRFALPAATRVEGVIYNIAGQSIRHLVDREFSTGQHTLTWDGRDDFGKIVASGTYFLLLKTDAQHFTRKLLLLR